MNPGDGKKKVTVLNSLAARCVQTRHCLFKLNIRTKDRNEKISDNFKFLLTDFDLIVTLRCFL